VPQVLAMRTEFLSLGSCLEKMQTMIPPSATSPPFLQARAVLMTHFALILICVCISKMQHFWGREKTDPKIKQIVFVPFSTNSPSEGRKASSPASLRGSDFSTLLINFLQIFSPGSSVWFQHAKQLHSAVYSVLFCQASQHMHLPKGCKVLSDWGLDTAELTNHTPTELKVTSVSERLLVVCLCVHCTCLRCEGTSCSSVNGTQEWYCSTVTKSF